MRVQSLSSVWDAIEDNPQIASSLKARSTLMIELSSMIENCGLTQAEAAEILGVTQPRVSDLMRGKINLFSLDMLMDMASSAGMSPQVKVSKPKAKFLKRIHNESKQRSLPKAFLFIQNK